MSPINRRGFIKNLAGATLGLTSMIALLPMQVHARTRRDSSGPIEATDALESVAAEVPDDRVTNTPSTQRLWRPIDPDVPQRASRNVV